MCRDYRLINRHTKSYKYAMPTLEKDYKGLEDSIVFSIIDLRSRYHQFLVEEAHCQKKAFWKIDEFGMDKLYDK